MQTPGRYYLDHASTSWPKPPGVVEAMVRYQTEWGASAGRATYQSALRADQIVQDARRKLIRFLHAKSVDEVAFCSNGTHALNAALLGIAIQSSESKPHIVTTCTEHNSVLRPLAMAAEKGWIEWTAVPCDSHGIVDPDRIRSAIRHDTTWVVVNHGSNVTGAVQDLKSIGAIAREKHARLLVDASQTLGYLPIDVHGIGIDCLASSGHKGLGGVLGTGLLYIRKEIQAMFAPVMLGGTGLASDRLEGPFDWQSIVESGNLNVPAIASLDAALDWHLANENTATIWHDAIQRVIDKIESTNRLRLVGPGKNQTGANNQRLPVFSIAPARGSSESKSRLEAAPSAYCQEMAILLDQVLGVECRAGLHCAGLIHSCLETTETSGTLRFSLGKTSRAEDIDALCDGIDFLESVEF